MKKALIVFLITFIVLLSPSFAGQEITDPEYLENFSKVVRHYGYVCDKCVRAQFYGKRHRGKTFWVICDADRNHYTVVIRPNGGWIVEPGIPD